MRIAGDRRKLLASGDAAFPRRQSGRRRRAGADATGRTTRRRRHDAGSKSRSMRIRLGCILQPQRLPTENAKSPPLPEGFLVYAARAPKQLQ